MAHSRVLVVDDDRSMVKLLRVNLEGDGMEVAEATTGRAGLEVVHNWGADIILLDLHLPDISGWEVLATVRSTESLRNTRVIIISVEPPDSTLIRQLRPDDYVQKPFDTRDLLMRMRRVVAQKAA
ncbi:MAG: response regulator transcription factor [Anaerolineae bacterium]